MHKGPEHKGPDPSPWFRESVLPLGELAMPDSGAEGTCSSRSVLSSLQKRGERGWG